MSRRLTSYVKAQLSFGQQSECHQILQTWEMIHRGTD